jgi:hypothetical protein
MIDSSQQGYIRMLTLRAMTLNDANIAKEIRPNTQASITNRKKLDWSLRLPAKMIGMGWANNLPTPSDKNALLDAWSISIMLDFDIQEPTLRQLSLTAIKKNVAKVTKHALDMWLPSISKLQTSITPFGTNRVHVGTLAVVKDKHTGTYGEAAFENVMRQHHRNGDLSADPCNRIYLVLWTLYNTYPLYLLTGRM